MLHSAEAGGILTDMSSPKTTNPRSREPRRERRSGQRIAAQIEVVLMLPAELGLGEKQWACCQASVVRVEDGHPRVGVAARIDRIDVLPEILS